MLTTDQIRHFHKFGYLVLPNVLSGDELNAVKNDCVKWIEEVEIGQNLRLANDIGCIIEPLRYSGERVTKFSKTDFQTYSQWRNQHTSNIASLLLQSLIASSALQILPSDKQRYFFNEQYIVKPPYDGSETSFGWHQDGQFLNPEHRIPSVACWCPLDDISTKNGSFYIQPYVNGENMFLDDDTLNSLATSSSYFNEWHSSMGLLSKPRSPPSENAFEVELAAGSMILISSHVWHSSKKNCSPYYRRVYMPQFSSGPVVDAQNNPVAYAIPI